MKKMIVSLLLCFLNIGYVSASKAYVWSFQNTSNNVINPSPRPTMLSNNERFLIIVNYATAGGVNIYFYDQFKTSHCVSSIDQTHMVSSLYFNETLVQMGEGCDGRHLYLFPVTYHGINYVLNEFKTKNFVNIADSSNSYIDTVSSNGFNQTMRKLDAISGRGGGL